MEFRERKLAVYIVVDVSGSMKGEPIKAINAGLQDLIVDLKRNPLALETVWVSVIQFGTEAKAVCPLTEVFRLSLPTLLIKGNSSIGAALKLLKTSLDNDYHSATSEHKGDYQPLVFLMTDGHPTDAWKRAADSLKSTGIPYIIACGLGKNVDPSVLKRIADKVLIMNEVSSDSLIKYFKWISQSVQTRSKNINLDQQFETDLLSDQFIELP